VAPRLIRLRTTYFAYWGLVEQGVESEAVVLARELSNCCLSFMIPLVVFRSHLYS